MQTHHQAKRIEVSSAEIREPHAAEKRRTETGPSVSRAGVPPCRRGASSVTAAPRRASACAKRRVWCSAPPKVSGRYAGKNHDDSRSGSSGVGESVRRHVEKAPPPLAAGMHRASYPRSMSARAREPEALAQGLIDHQTANRRAGGLGGCRGQLQHVLTVDAVVADAADVDGDHRQTREHRLCHDDAEALRLREIQEDVRRRRLARPVGPDSRAGSHDPEGRGPRAAPRSPLSEGRRRRRRASPRRPPPAAGPSPRSAAARFFRATSLPAAASRTPIAERIVGLERRLAPRDEEGDHVPFATAWKEVAARLLERLCQSAQTSLTRTESKRSSGP